MHTIEDAVSLIGMVVIIVSVIVYIRVRKVKYPEILKPLSIAFLALSFYYPRFLFPQMGIFLLNCAFNVLAIGLAIWYLVGTRKREGKKAVMIICLIIGSLILLGDLGNPMNPSF